jgi:peptide/nickel transport system permease protein
VPLAMRAARKQGGLFDKISSGASFGLLSVPSFVMIVYMVKFIAETLHIPGTAPGAFSQNFLPGLGQFFSNPGGSFAILGHNILALLIPALTLSIGSFVIYFRVLRSDVIANLQEEFVTMARSKGLSRNRIMWRHVLRPSSVALLSTAGINIGGLLAGGFVVQFVMAIPGLGYAFTNAITTKNYLLIQAIVFIISVSILCITFFVDFMTAIIDPRISRD